MLKLLALAFEAHAKKTPDKGDDLIAGVCVSLITALENPETLTKLKKAE